MAAGRLDAVSIASSASARGIILRDARDEFARSMKREALWVAVRGLFDGERLVKPSTASLWSRVHR